MNEKLKYLDHYLQNTVRMLQALQKDDLETVNQCLDRNTIIMKAYDDAPPVGGGTMENKNLRDKMEAVVKANRQCFQFAENKCRSLKSEMESADKNRDGFKKYGGRQPSHIPRFIDNRT